MAIRNFGLCIPFSRFLLIKSWRLWLCTIASIGIGGMLSGNSNAGAPIAGCMLLLVIVFLFAALTLPEPNQQGASGFPSYMFLLPVGNVELVAWPMILSATFLALTGGAIAVVMLGRTASLADTWWIAPYLAGNVCMFQAVSWLPLKRPELRVTLSIPTVASIVGGPAAFGFGVLPAIPAGLMYALIMLSSIAISVRGVGRARHGLAVVGSDDDANYRIPDAPAFRSRLASQEWLEERRNGLVMKVLTAMFLVLFGLIAIVMVPTDPIYAQIGSVQISISALSLAVLALVIPPYFGFGGCCGSERDNLAKDRSVVPFLALRPLSSLEIVEAKIRMSIPLAFRLAVPSLGVVLGILLLPTSIDGDYRPTMVALAHLLTVPQAFGLVGLYVVMILSGVKSSVSGIWCSLGRLPHWVMYLLALLPLGLVVGTVTRLVTHSDEIPRFIQLLPKLVWAYSALKLTALIGATWVLRQARLVPDAMILKWIAGCAIVGVALYGFASWAVPETAYSRAAIAAQIFCMLPLVRVALAPVFVDRGRHG